MPNYRRPHVPGSSIFFTVALAERGRDTLVRHVDGLRDAVRQTRAERPFRIDAWVVLPDHLHAVWTLPAGDVDYSVRWGAIKARFSMAMRRAQGGGRIVAAAVLGAPHPGRGRPARACPVLLDQSGEARIVRCAGGSAPFVRASGHDGRAVRAGDGFGVVGRGSPRRVGRCGRGCGGVNPALRSSKTSGGCDPPCRIVRDVGGWWVSPTPRFADRARGSGGSRRWRATTPARGRGAAGRRAGGSGMLGGAAERAGGVGAAVGWVRPTMSRRSMRPGTVGSTRPTDRRATGRRIGRIRRCAGRSGWGCIRRVRGPHAPMRMSVTYGTEAVHDEHTPYAVPCAADDPPAAMGP